MAVQQLHGLEIPGGIVLPVHAAQCFVAAALEGQVELGAEVRQVRAAAAEILRDGAGLQTAQPDADAGSGGADGLNQIHKAQAVFQIRPPGGDLNAGQHDLPVARRGQ